MRKVVMDMVYELAKKDPRIFFIGSDLGTEVLKNFKQEMPGRFLMEGISEQHLIGMAAGLAAEGKVVYLNTIATFLTRRCFEQIVLDLCLHKTNVRLISSGGGIVYAPLGPTHLAIEDIAILRVIPNMTILAPADAEEMRRLMPATVDYPGPIYIRLGKGGDPIVAPNVPFEIGKGYVIREGADALIVTTGVTLKVALDAADQLVKENVNVSILHLPTIKPLDTKTILDSVAKVSSIVVVEEHTVLGGLGSAVAEVLMEANFSTPKKFKMIGIPDVFPEGYGSQASMMEKYGITAKNVVETVKKLNQ